MINDLNDPNDLNLSGSESSTSATSPKINDTHQLPFEAFEDIAFDEMNIVETPFTLLTQKSLPSRTLELSPGGTIKLVCAEGYTLPSALGEQAVLALMWMTKDQNGFRIPQVTFQLRDLVQNYMYPRRDYRPSKTTLASVENQLNRVAFTRIVTDRWYDKTLGHRVTINASIIDYIKVIDPGGRNRSRVLEVGWGQEFYKSITANYTKALDSKVYFQITRPLERRLYRWLDRQLSRKQVQRVPSILHFAKYKLGMSHQHIDRGGRTGSNYIRKRLEEALKGLDNKGFSVCLLVDSSRDDFSLEFHRLAERGPNQVVTEDPAGDLVKSFYVAAHGLSPDGLLLIKPRDRQEAQKWIEAYGLDDAQALVRCAVEIQKQARGPRILTFAGLARYEGAALADLKHQRAVTDGQMKLELNEGFKKLFDDYRASLLRHIEHNLGPGEDERIKAEAEQWVSEGPESVDIPGFARQAIVNNTIRRMKLAQAQAFSFEEFQNFESMKGLISALQARHGFDPLSGR